MSVTKYRYSNDTQDVVFVQAQRLAQQDGANEVEPIHLLAALMLKEHSSAAKAVEFLRKSPQGVHESALRRFHSHGQHSKTLPFSKATKKVLKAANDEKKGVAISTADILLAISYQEEHTDERQALDDHNLSATRIRHAMSPKKTGTRPIFLSV